MKKTIFLILAMAVLGEAMWAQASALGVAPETVKLTIEQAVGYALKNSHGIKSGAIDLEIQKRKAGVSWNQFLPEMMASGTLNRANEYNDIAAQMGLPSPPVTEGDHWKVIGNLSLSLDLSLAMLESMKATKAEYEAGKITWEQVLRQTELEVRKRFYGILLQQENLNIKQESLENARRRMVQAQTNYQNGRVPQLQYLQAQVAYENKRPEVLQAEQGITHNLDTFAFLLGMCAGTKISLQGDIEPQYLDLDAGVLIQEHLSKRLDFIDLQKKMDVLKLQLQALNLRSYTPSLSLSYNLQPVAGLKSLTDGVKDPWSDNGGLSITLAFNLTNLLPQSSTRQQARDVQDNIRKLELGLVQAADNAKNEVTSLVDSLALSRSQIAARQATVNLARNAYNQTLAAYQNGAAEQLELRTAGEDLDTARLGLLTEQMNYMTGVLDLEYALNTKLGR
jgi:outer membrane protein TolC